MDAWRKATLASRSWPVNAPVSGISSTHFGGHLIYIAAKTYGHASHCAKSRGLDPFSWKFLDGGYLLHATQGESVIFYGAWKQHPEWRDIELTVRDRGGVVIP